MNDFRVELGSYVGPLDLLLYLAKSSEVPVADIPVAEITEQYLRFVDLMEMLNVELSSEFLVMASTLMEIKSRMLVPTQDEEEEEEMEDPRLELIQQLVEYRKVKERAKVLDGKASEQSLKFPRTARKTVVDEGQPLEAVDIWDLVTAFDKLMKQINVPVSREIVDDEVAIHLHMENILNRLKERSSMPFDALFEGVRDKGSLIGIFLAILELARQHQISVEQDGQFGEILIGLPSSPKA